MFSITRTVFRTALIGGLAVGGLTLIVGPQRVMGGFAQARQSAIAWFDSNVDDPIVIRQQLRALQKDYPEKMRELRRTLAEVDAEISTLQRDQENATRLASRAEEDLASLRNLVEKAGYVQQASYTEARPVLVKFQGRQLTVEQAYTRAHAIKRTYVNAQDRLAANERDLQLLAGQRERLAGQLGEMEQEFAALQNQSWQVERQIASIERNQALITMLEEREDLLATPDRWNIRSVEQLTNRLNAIHAEHEAMLETLTARAAERNYEREAMGRAILEGESPDPFTLEARPLVRRFPVAPIIIDENTPSQRDAEAMAALKSAGN